KCVRFDLIVVYDSISRLYSDSNITNYLFYYDQEESFTYDLFTEFQMDEFLGLTLDSVRPIIYVRTDTIGECYFVLGNPNSTINPMSFDDAIYSKEIDGTNAIRVAYEIGDYTYNGGKFYPGIQTEDYDTVFLYMHPGNDYNIIQNYDGNEQLWNKFRMNWDLYFSGQLWPKWLEISNPIGTIDSGQSLDLVLDFDLSKLEINNEYTATINVISNDDSLGIQGIPVSLNYNNVSVNENEFNVGVLTYPNPTTDQINLVSNQEIQFVEVFNIVGQMVGNFEVSNLETQIDLSVLKSGQYILRIHFEGGQLEKNIIKQ
ncbi:MAG: T9SS type A sorting domain-containing protein, partial [Flavobacteriales bacterium]